MADTCSGCLLSAPSWAALLAPRCTTSVSGATCLRDSRLFGRFGRGPAVCSEPAGELLLGHFAGSHPQHSRRGIGLTGRERIAVPFQEKHGCDETCAFVAVQKCVILRNTNSV